MASWALENSEEGPGSLDDGPGWRVGLTSSSRCFRPASMSTRRFLLRGVTNGFFDGELFSRCGRVRGVEVGCALVPASSLEGREAGKTVGEPEAWIMLSFGRSSAQSRTRIPQSMNMLGWVKVILHQKSHLVGSARALLQQ